MTGAPREPGERTPVLVVGGGLAGLSTAVFLSWHGIACLLVERAEGTSAHPRFRGLTVRSMELYRSVGLAERIQATGTPGGDIGGIARVRNLADPEVHWEKTAWEDDITGISPADACSCDQNRLEPLLAEHAERHGAEVRFGTELVSLRQHGEGVDAVLRDRTTGEEHTVRAAYAVAADGTRSSVRTSLGIGRHGPGLLGHQVSVVFDAGIEPVLDGRDFGACYVADVGGALLPRDEGLWQLSVSYRPDLGQRPEDFTDSRCMELIRTALGRSEVAAQVRSAAPWQVEAQVADRFQHGRVFLVGDAAHAMPPSGGFGGNTGVQDAYDLSWKLAAALAGEAGAGLLATYDAERRPVAELTLAQALARMPMSWAKGEAVATPPPLLDHNTVSLGYLYRSRAVAAEPGPSEADAVEDPWHPSGRPGARAPHLEIEHDGRVVSLLDLFGRGLVLLTCCETDAWTVAVGALLERRPELRLVERKVGAGCAIREVGDRWTQRYGVAEDGAVLVRPDGYVGWRAHSLPEQPEEALAAAVARLYDAESAVVGAGAERPRPMAGPKPG